MYTVFHVNILKNKSIQRLKKFLPSCYYKLIIEIKQEKQSNKCNKDQLGPEKREGKT